MWIEYHLKLLKIWKTPSIKNQTVEFWIHMLILKFYSKMLPHTPWKWQILFFKEKIELRIKKYSYPPLNVVFRACVSYLWKLGFKSDVYHASLYVDYAQCHVSYIWVPRQLRSHFRTGLISSNVFISMYSLM